VTDVARKRLLYRATHRGFKEADIIIGGYVRHIYEQLDQSRIDQLEHLLSAPEQDLYQWILAKKPVPAEFLSPSLEALQNYAASPKVAREVKIRLSHSQG
jgi:antitoxin CptB